MGLCSSVKNSEDQSNTAPEQNRNSGSLMLNESFEALYKNSELLLTRAQELKKNKRIHTVESINNNDLQTSTNNIKDEKIKNLLKNGNFKELIIAINEQVSRMNEKNEEYKLQNQNKVSLNDKETKIREISNSAALIKL